MESVRFDIQQSNTDVDTVIIQTNLINQKQPK